MSPEIRVNGQLVADVPDETGLYKALDGSPLYVDVARIEARSAKQRLLIEGRSVGGSRVIGLTQEGKGSTDKVKKGGDGREPSVSATLHDRPVRISYRDRIWHASRSLGWPRGGYYESAKRTYYNPRWMR